MLYACALLLYLNLLVIMLYIMTCIIIIYYHIQFQRAQVEKYCYHKPKSTRKVYEGLILVSKEDKAGLCAAPKAASSTQIILMIRAVLGTIPNSYVTGGRTVVNYDVLKREATKLSLKSVPEMERPTVLREYFLLFMFRNPFDRLLSSYRSKLPSLSLNRTAYLKDKEWIVSHYHPKAYNDWLKAKKSYSVNISFSDFVDYLTTQNRLTDGHFMPLVSLCQPCEANYTYYGNFKTFGEDIGVLMDKIHASKKELKEKYNKSLSSRIVEYYGQLNETQKVRVINRLSPDLELFYLIFPTEKKDDEEMLGMKLDEYVNL